MEKTYFDRVHAWGRIWITSALLMMLCIPLSICLYYNVWPPISGILSALLKIIPLFWTTAIIEVISYSPILGAGGMYVSFVTGNISNLKLPCAMAAMDNADIHPNTDEGEVITTIATAASAITTTVIIAVGVLLFTPILPLLTDKDSVFAPAFQQVLPALFGALGANYFLKHWKISILPILAGVITLLFAPGLPVGTLLPITVIVSIGGAFLMYKKNWI